MMPPSLHPTRYTFGDLQLVEQADHILRHEVVGERRGAARAAAVTAAVHRDHAMAVCHQHWNQVAEIVRIAEAAVQQQDGSARARRCRAPLGIPDMRALNVGGAAHRSFGQRGQRRKRLPGRGSGGLGAI